MKKQGFGGILFDFIMTILTGGLWLIWVLIRYLRTHQKRAQALFFSTDNILFIFCLACITQAIMKRYLVINMQIGLLRNQYTVRIRIADERSSKLLPFLFRIKYICYNEIKLKEDLKMGIYTFKELIEGIIELIHSYAFNVRERRKIKKRILKKQKEEAQASFFIQHRKHAVYFFAKFLFELIFISLISDISVHQC